MMCPNISYLYDLLYSQSYDMIEILKQTIENKLFGMKWEKIPTHNDLKHFRH